MFESIIERIEMLEMLVACVWLTLVVFGIILLFVIHR